MSHRLHAIHIHKQNADDRPGQHVTDEHLYTVGDHFAVVDKYTDDNEILKLKERLKDLEQQIVKIVENK